jgi:hypothetical protein
MDKTTRAVVSGSRLFNTGSGLPRNKENIPRSLGTFQSGSPPGHATIVRRGTDERRFSTAYPTRILQRFAPWMHPLGETISASLTAGLTLRWLQKHDADATAALMRRLCERSQCRFSFLLPER